MTLDSSKNLGGIGALLMFIGVFPYLSYFGIAEFVGVVLVLVALYGFAEQSKEGGIFNNAIYGVGAVIAGGVVSVAAVFTVFNTVIGSLTDLLHQLYPTWNGDWATLQSIIGLTPTTTNLNPSDLYNLIASLLLVVVVIWIFSIIATYLVRRSLKLVSAKTGVELFGTAGTLLLAGAIILVIFGLGLILMWIASLLLAIAFFRVKSVEQPTPAATVPPPAAI